MSEIGVNNISGINNQNNSLSFWLIKFLNVKKVPNKLKEKAITPDDTIIK